MDAAAARHSGPAGAGPKPSPRQRLGAPPRAPRAPRDLRGRVVESLLALATSTAIGEVANVLATLLLAHLLAPADFGAIGVGTLVISAFTVLRNAFVFQTLIHRADRVREAADQMILVSGAMGLVLAGLGWAGADALGAFFHSPASAIVLRLMAVAFLINSIGVVPDTLFEKELRFRRKMWLEAARPLITAVVSVWLAALGAGPASVGWAWVAAYAVWTIGLYVLTDYRPRPRWDPILLGELLNYGRYVLGGALLIFFFTNLDNASVGRLLGARALGYYAFAFLLAYFPAQVMTGGVVSSVLLPLYAKLQGQREAQRASLSATLRWVSLYAAPLCVGTIVLGPVALSLVYGPKWAPAFAPLQVLAIYGFAHTYFQVIRNLCNGVGRARAFWWISGLQLALVVPLLIPAPLRFGITGTSLVFTGAKLAATAVAFAYAARLVGVQVSRLLRPIALPLGLSLLAAFVAVLAARALQGPAGRHGWLPAVAEGGTFCLGYLALCSIMLRADLAEVLAGLRRRQPPTSNPPTGTDTLPAPRAESRAASPRAASPQPGRHDLARTGDYHAHALALAVAELPLRSDNPAPRRRSRRQGEQGRGVSSVRRRWGRIPTRVPGAVAGGQRRPPATAILAARLSLIVVISFLTEPRNPSPGARHSEARRASQAGEEWA